MTKSNSPAFPLYPGDLLVDENVALMTNQELGCFIRFKCFNWREGSIPADIKKLARLCGEDAATMAQLWPAISPCFIQSPEDPERLVDPKLEAIREKQEAYRKERAEAGRKGAKAKWGAASKVDESAIDEDGTAHGQANGSAMTEPMAKDAFSSSISKDKNTVPASPALKFSAVDFLLHAGAEKQIAADWLQVRKTKRLASTKTALEDVLQEIEKAQIPINDALRLCCKRGWGGFMAKWLEGDSGSPGGRPVWEQ